MRPLPLFLAVGLAALAASAALSQEAAGARFALVIGTSDYDHIADLANPDGDADAIADLLKSLGFDVTEESDRDLEDLRDALADFAEDAAGADLALVFYAGHGTEVAGENRLLPTDASAESLDALAATSLPLTDIARTLATIAPAAILIVDACRNDPFAGTPLADATRTATALEPDPARPVAPGFARVGPAQGLVYAFSTAPGDTASDGPEGAHSPFAAALLRHLSKPGLELRTVLTLVTEDVHDRTRSAQTPYFESGLPSLVFAAGQPADLSERDALLLAMADLSPDLRAAVETLAAARSMPLAPLYAALLTLPPDITREDRDRALTEAADAYASLQDQLTRLSEADPRVADLRTAAAADLDLGQTQAAQEKFRQAIALDAEGREAGRDLYLARTLSQAETLLLSAEAARAALDHETAIAALEQATALYAEAAPFGLPPEVQSNRTNALWDLGDLHLLTGNSTAALAAYADWNAIATTLSDAAPGDSFLLRDLAASQQKIGDVLAAQGDLPGALARYSAGLLVAKEMAAQEPDNTLWKRDLSISHIKIGDVSRMLGDLNGALHNYQTAMEITQTIASQHPDNANLQRDLSVNHNRIGEVLLLQGKLAEALERYNSAMAIVLALSEKEPENAARQRDLSVGYNKIGDVLLAQGDPNGALENYRAGLAVAGALAARDPGVAEWQRDLSISHERIGDALRMLGDLSGALESYRIRVSIVRTLAERDPRNTELQRDLAVGHDRIATVLWSQGDLGGALENDRAALEILGKLAALDSTNAQWQRDLSVSHNKIGDALRAQGDLPGALESYRASMAIRQTLAEMDAGLVQAQLDLVISHYNLSTVSPDPRPDLEAALAILRQLQSEGRLPPANEGWIDFLEQELAALVATP